jgi:putative intracellular protease/amidase/YHS domain-containing protein
MQKIVLTRRQLLQASGMAGLAASIPFVRSAGGVSVEAKGSKSSVVLSPLKPPASGPIPVAFPISDGAVLIDFVGPWEVFLNASVPGRDMMDSAFDLYTVAEKAEPVNVGGGMKVVPNYTFANAPAPKVIVIPAQGPPTDAMLQWIREATKKTDLTMSVCTGAFVLAASGLLNGRAATTHHTAYSDLQMKFPDVHVKRGVRFVEEGNLATAGGLTSGMDLALRVVGRYFGVEAVERTAFQLEYLGEGWKDADSNSEFAVKPKGDICAVCWMQVDRKSALNSVYKGQTYYFCMQSHKDAFDAKPDPYIELLLKS